MRLEVQRISASVGEAQPDQRHRHFVSLAGAMGMLVVSMLVITLGAVTFAPTSMAAVANMAPPRRSARYMGLFGLTEALGWSVGPFIGGLLFDAFSRSPMVPWGAIATLGLMAAVGFAATLRPEPD